MPSAVRDVTWMSDQSVHLAKWMPAFEQVTVTHEDVFLLETLMMV